MFTYLDCTRALSTEIFGQRFGIRNGEFGFGTGISSGSVEKRRTLEKQPSEIDGGEKHCTEDLREHDHSERTMSHAF